jgi:hypothetical protein
MSNLQFYKWIDALLLCIKERGIAPPQAARWSFLACSLAWDALQYVSDSSFTVIDTSFQPAGKGEVLQSDVLTCFIITAIYESWKVLFDTYMGAPVSYLDAVWALQSPFIHTYSQSATVLNSWLVRARSYLASRDGDGWKTAGTPPGPIINAGNSIVSTGYSSPGVIQDLSSLPNLYKWTPLSTGGTVQSYLVPAWGTVSPLVPIQSQVDDLAAFFFPSSSSKQDIDEASVLDVSKTLTDQQKMVAELWTAGSNTVTPPGMWLFFTSKVARTQSMSCVEQITMFKYVSAALFQAGISAWYLKWKYQQSRPIQNIRYTYRGQSATTWVGTGDLGTWTPYQSLTGLTPPHPDFVSGHSTFSSAAARVLSLYLGTPSIPTIQFESNDLALLSPIFSSNTGKTLANVFTMYAGCSTHQPGVVPNSGATLSYATWDDMASAAGMSRIYGGIHVESSNQGGLAVGRLVGDSVFASF